MRGTLADVPRHGPVLEPSYSLCILHMQCKNASDFWFGKQGSFSLKYTKTNMFRATTKNREPKYRHELGPGFGSGLVLAWFWFGSGLVLAWFWLGSGLALAWFWYASGLALV